MTELLHVFRGLHTFREQVLYTAKDCWGCVGWAVGGSVGCGVGWGECGMDNQVGTKCVWTHVPAFFVERLLAGVWRQEHLVSRRSARP